MGKDEVDCWSLFAEVALAVGTVAESVAEEAEAIAEADTESLLAEVALAVGTVAESVAEEAEAVAEADTESLLMLELVAET